VVQAAGFDVEHLPFFDCKGMVTGAMIQDGDEGAAGDAVRQFIRVCIPVRFADGFGTENLALQRHALQDGQFVDRASLNRAELGLVEGLVVLEVEDVAGIGRHCVYVILFLFADVSLYCSTHQR
jgi:hypothetical protein